MIRYEHNDRCSVGVAFTRRVGLRGVQVHVITTLRNSGHHPRLRAKHLQGNSLQSRTSEQERGEQFIDTLD